MLKTTLRMAAMAATAVTLTALAGCGETNAPPVAEAPAPPPPEAPPPELLGGPPPRDFTPMAPIPNPEDMTPAERARVYGRHYEGLRHHRHTGWQGAGWHGGAHHASVHHVAAVTAAPAPVAPAVVKTPAPVAVATPAPLPVVKPVAAPVQTPIQKLQTAVSDVGKTSVLAVPGDLSAAKPGKVTVTLPPNLLDAIRAEAAKLGLIKPAHKTEVTATLSGDGYVITPNGPQTAPLKAGKPTVFTWQVLPEAGAKGALKADVSAVLKGAGAAESFAIAHLEQTVASVEAATAAEAAKTTASKAPSKGMIAAVIGVVALLILLLAGRAASNRREAENRRRRARALATASTDDSLAPVITPAPVVEAAPAVEPVHVEPAPVVDVAHVEPEPVVAAAPIETVHTETAHEAAVEAAEAKEHEPA